MIVVSIIAILTASATPSFHDSLARSKVRKTADLISEVIILSQSEALRRNIKIYVTVTAGDICIGSALAGCDLRKESLISGVSVSAPNLVLSPFYGTPSPAPATFTASYSGVTQTVSINRLGLITIERTP